MRLLNATCLEPLALSVDVPSYCILSDHLANQEITFQDIEWHGRDLVKLRGSEKLLNAAQLAREHGFEYIWIDTCCIDKSSSSELSEAAM
jgi:hypothetical protein